MQVIKTVVKSRFGLSEVLGAVLILVISVIFGIALFTLFISYVGSSLQTLYTGPLGPRCEFSIVGYSINKTNGGYVVAVALYNYGDAQCVIEGALVINATTGNIIDVIPYSSPIKLNGFAVVKVNLGPIKPPIIIRLYSSDGSVGDAYVQ